MGLQDYYVASVKGAIYKQLPNAKIVDISHLIPPFDIEKTAFILKNSYQDFPEGTVHIIGVNPEADKNVAHVAVQFDNHFFVAADNGVFSILFNREPTKIVELNLLQDNDDLTFPTRDIFVKAACHLARGGTMEIIGKPKDTINKLELFRPVTDENTIRGSVRYIDVYGNVITNITEKLFKEIGKGRDFVIYYSYGSYSIKTIHKAYHDVPHGEKVAIFGAAGYLEIAINKGVKDKKSSASNLFSLNLKDVIRIEFSP